MNQYTITVTEKMPADRDDIEKSAVVLAADEAEAIAKAVQKLYGKAAGLHALGWVDGSYISDKGHVWRTNAEGNADRVTGMVWLTIENDGPPAGPGRRAGDVKKIGKSIRLTPDAWARVEQLAADADISQGEVIEGLIANA